MGNFTVFQFFRFYFPRNGIDGPYDKFYFNFLSPCLFNLYAEYIMQNAGLDEAQAGIKIAGRNINNLKIQMTPPLWQNVKKN